MVTGRCFGQMGAAIKENGERGTKREKELYIRLRGA